MLKLKLPNKTVLILSGVLFIAFFTKALMFLDPDYGWRLKSGQLYLNSGIPQTDPYTYTMSSFPWVDHAWLQSFSMAYLESLAGKTLASFVYTVLAMFAIYFVYLRSVPFVKKVAKTLKAPTPKNRFFLNFLNLNHLGFFGSFAMFLGISIFFKFFGVRVQVVSWLMLSILLYFISNKEKWKKFKFYVPAFFLVWANLHGSFAIGLETLVVFLTLKSIRQKKLYLSEITVVLISILVTLLNPYGFGTWKEVWSSVSDSSLRWQIIEWMPALTMFDFSMIFLIGISTGLFWKYKSKFELEEIGLFLLFFVQALLSRRHLPLWAILAVPFCSKAIYFLAKDSIKFNVGKIRFKKMYKAVYVATIIAFSFQAVSSFKEAYILREGYFYPDKAVNYLQENVTEKDTIFSNYGWGGYLIWKLPEKKVFIDGRMPSWRWKSPDTELSDAFKTYNELQRGDIDYKEVFNKFNINIVLWPVPLQDTPYSEILDKLESFIPFTKSNNDFDFLDQLEKDGWEKVYSDNVAIIFKTP